MPCAAFRPEELCSSGLFCSTFCNTKSRKKKSPQGGGEAAERQKDLIGLVQSFCLCSLIRGSQNLDSPFGKDLILFVRSRHCGELNRGLQNLDVLCKENELILFACTKRTKSTPEVCEPLDSGDDSNLRSIQDFGGSDRPASCNRPRREPQPFRISPVRI